MKFDLNEHDLLSISCYMLCGVLIFMLGAAIRPADEPTDACVECDCTCDNN